MIDGDEVGIDMLAGNVCDNEGRETDGVGGGDGCEAEMMTVMS